MVQRGSLEALHLLSIHYPPASLPTQWGCSQQPYTIVEILLDLLESSQLGWSVQGSVDIALFCSRFYIIVICTAQSELLDLSSSIFLSCGVANMQHENTANPVWDALENDTLVQFAKNLLSHNVKLLSVFVHIIEQREPEIRDKASR